MYKDLEIEIEKTWELKTTTAPVVIGALGGLSRRGLKTTSARSQESSE